MIINETAAILPTFAAGVADPMRLGLGRIPIAI